MMALARKKLPHFAPRISRHISLHRSGRVPINRDPRIGRSYAKGPHHHQMVPLALISGLDRVSDEHVAHARDEWPWLDTIKPRLRNQLVPWDREREILKLLRDFGSTDGTEKSPPFEDRELLDYLVEVGILRERPDGRVDAPDLFLYGLGLRRKGGVRRR